MFCDDSDHPPDTAYTPRRYCCQACAFRARRARKACARNDKAGVYPNRDEAIRAAQAIATAHEQMMYPYECPAGDGWHLTSSPPWFTVVVVNGQEIPAEHVYDLLRAMTRKEQPGLREDVPAS